MNYYINGRFLSQNVTGVQRYAREITKALDQIIDDDSEDEWFILVPRNVIDMPEYKKIQINKCGVLKGHIWEQIELPVYSRDGLLLNFCNCAPMIKKNQVVALHDAAIKVFPSAYSWLYRTWCSFLYKVIGKRAKIVFTVSEFSKKQLSKYFGISDNKIVVAYNGIEHMDEIECDNTIINEMDLQDEKFVLAVSSMNPTKNFALVLETAKKLSDIEFIIVGGKDNLIFKSKKNNNESNVRYTGYISDEKLVSLYKNAAVFVYPSLYEGFGIPPIEAISQGCPTIVSMCASLPEICGDNVSYCQVDNPDDLSKKILKCLQYNKGVKEMMDIRKKYSWMKSAKIILEKIREKK